ncbi:unnamed protein product [Brassica oleracea]
MSVQRVSTDSISSLLDEVLGKVLSLLPTKQAASTSVMSKRWRNLLSLVDSLDLSDDATATGDPRGFPDFVDKTLALLRNSSIIKRFSLRCEHTHDASRVDNWIRTVLERRSFSELHLESEYIHVIETKSFASDTLVKMRKKKMMMMIVLFYKGRLVIAKTSKYIGIILQEYHDGVFGGHSGVLKTIKRIQRLFHWSKLKDDVQHYVSECTIRQTHKYSTLSPGGLLQPTPLPTVIWSEVSMDFIDSLPKSEGFSVIMVVVDRLSKYAHFIGLKHPYTATSVAEKFIREVRGRLGGILIKSLSFSYQSPKSLEVFHLYSKSMPVFHKLLTLSFESDKERGWQVVPLLLNNSPNLETLVIKGLVHRVTDRCGDACVCVARKNKEEEVCCLSTCQVKVLKVSGYRGTRRELNQMKHFLGNLKCLETVKVDVEVENHREDKNVNKNYQRITNALTKLPIASSNPFLLIYPLCN